MPNVTWNRAEFSAMLARDLGRELPWATVLALNATGEDIRKAVRDEWIPRSFDRPTRYTINSSRLKRASKAMMVAEVLFKDTSTWSIDGEGHYLVPQVRGGRRVHTRFEQRLVRNGVMRADEYALPGAACPMDAHGNVRAGVHAQIITQLGIGDAGYNFYESKKSKARKARKNAARYFVSDGNGHLPRGIWARDGRRVRPVFIFASRAPNYRIRFPWKQWAERLAHERMPINFRREAAKLLARRNR